MSKTEKPQPTTKEYLIVLGIFTAIAVAAVWGWGQLGKNDSKATTNPYDYSSVTDCRLLLDSRTQLTARADQAEQEARLVDGVRDNAAAAKKVTAVRMDLAATQKRIDELGCK